MRYVEIGRVALVNYGRDYGKLVVIVDVIDQNRALVDAPDLVRGPMNFKRLTLTDIKIDIPRIPKKKSLIAAMEAADVKNKWENSSWGRKLIVQKRRASLNDLDRFKVMLAKIKLVLLLSQIKINSMAIVRMKSDGYEEFEKTREFSNVNDVSTSSVEQIEGMCEFRSYQNFSFGFFKVSWSP
ncbi:60S ribosomal protein L14-2-like isoform X3 [Asparagus officinalis]|uniref:60S ribosomal protein L14-2-like isoform X3 n=1 Tax=Asparagus officinalis TaxID=4686 RepID=UPI00098E27A4|nr:60S ribosomal protein L14-2-like isoform X3 [Asparagus officinalis]